MTILVYKPALNGPFVFDDINNIVNNEKLRMVGADWQALVNSISTIPNGMYGRPISMMTFALNYMFSNGPQAITTETYGFKVVNLGIHLINGILIYAVVNLIQLTALKNASRTASDKWLPVLTACAWLLHPFNANGVLYVVQRMTSLSAMFTLAGIMVYILGRIQLMNNERLGYFNILISIIIFSPLAFLCKEIGILLPAYIFLYEICFWRFKVPVKAARNFLLIFHLVFFLIPVMVLCLTLLANHTWLFEGYSKRDFSLEQRLMTETRVVWFYIKQTISPEISGMGLYHDDFKVSKGLFNPIETLASIAGLFVVTWGAYIFRNKDQLVTFSIGFFLVGHSLESTFIPLEIMHEHRNYLPGLGLVLLVMYLLNHQSISKNIRTLGRLAAILLLVLFAIDTRARSIEWSTAETLWVSEVLKHPKSSRANVSLADYYSNLIALNSMQKENNINNAKASYENALEIDAFDTSALFGLIKLNINKDQTASTLLISRLERALRLTVLPVNTNDRLIDLAICTKNKNCTVGRLELSNLIDASLLNPFLRGRERALLLSAKIFFEYQIERNYANALKATQDAILLDNDIAYEIWLLQIYISMKELKLAEHQYEKLKKINPLFERSEDVMSFEHQINFSK